MSIRTFLIIIIASAFGYTVAQVPKKQDQSTQPVLERSADSIALRVRRVTHEDAYIVVPATSKIIKEDKDGNGRLDFDAFVAEGIRLSKEVGVEWRVESVATEAHPIQQPKPENRKSFDGFSVLGK